MKLKSLVPTILLMIVVAAIAYSVGKDGLPGRSESQEQQQKQNEQARVVARLSSAENVEHVSAKQAILDSLRKVDATIEDITIEQTPVADVFWVMMPNYEILVMSSDGRYLLGRGVNEFVDGGLQAVNSIVLDEVRRNMQKEIITVFASGHDTHIIYPAVGEKKASVYVFTDVNCGYCRKFHHDVPELTGSGVEVHYLAGPFFSRDRESLEKIWCSEDPLLAMTQVKQGQKLKGVKITEQCEQIVTEHMSIGQRLGVRGTPAVYAQDGEQLGGYVEPKKLVQMLTNK